MWHGIVARILTTLCRTWGGEPAAESAITRIGNHHVVRPDAANARTQATNVGYSGQHA